MQKIKQLTPYIVATCIGIGIALIIKLLFHPVVIQGSSMEPAYHSGDIVSCTTDFTPESIKRGDVIVFKPAFKQYVKRVIALPGETIEIIDGYVYINGDLLTQYHGEDIIDAGILTGKSMTLNENEYFCLGDNRNNSRDCRIIGPARFEQIGYVVEEILYKKGENQ